MVSMYMNVNIVVGPACSLRSAGSLCAGLPQSRGGKRLNEQAEQGKPFWVAVFLETDSHIQMTFFGLRVIGAAETIPPGKVETEIAVGLANDRRMMDAVHVRSDKKQAQ
jgi:hypothetical protein